MRLINVFVKPDVIDEIYFRQAVIHVRNASSASITPFISAQISTNVLRLAQMLLARNYSIMVSHTNDHCLP